ncbi:tetratricopeptide repeat protein [Rummeliibacillus suwonensis]|uniref:tetratricopeptide repeat protein n=1 Tax=Rummeliibacillus suwonensis TaxID=1306154 RepID=UPI0011B4C582|nr:tetratricopeptide repeat protein [Rummeliibacillus suwonensis]
MNKLSNAEDLAKQLADRMVQQQQKKPSAKSYLELSYLFEQSDKLNKAKYILQEGVSLYPTNMALHHTLWSLYTKQNERKEKFKHFPRILKNSFRRRPLKFYEHLQNVLQQNHLFEQSLSITKLQLQEQPRHIGLLRVAIQKSLALRHFEEALAYSETLKSQLTNIRYLAKLNMRIGMIYMLMGYFEKAEEQFTYCREAYKELLPKIYKDGYEKLVIFNNGESSIEYYKYIYPTKRVVATFDSIDKTDKAKPFAYKALKKKSVDLISLRRRTVTNYHQDISREEYYHTIEKLIPFYEKRFAYGTSLGGYCALYFGSTIPECKILSCAPRNSAHPNYGTRARVQSVFTHSLSHPVNTEIQPIICYDPKQRVDHHYITAEIQHSYPNAIFKHFYYAGHRVPFYLQQAGILKDIVSRFLEEQPIPDYDRKLHSKSAEYHRVLAMECKRHQKLHWALDLAEKSVELTPTYDRSLALRIEILLCLQRYDECIVYANEAIQIHPTLARFYILLADTYIAKGNLDKAKDILESAGKSINSQKITHKLTTLKKQMELPTTTE